MNWGEKNHCTWNLPSRIVFHNVQEDRNILKETEKYTGPLQTTRAGVSYVNRVLKVNLCDNLHTAWPQVRSEECIKIKYKR